MSVIMMRMTMSTLSTTTATTITALSRMMIPTSLLMTAYYQFVVAVGVVVVTAAVSQDASSSCPSQGDSAWSIFLLQVVIYLSGTIETWVRAFCFGFGVHILIYLLMVNPNATFEELKARMNVSLTAGVAFGCVVYGGSMVRYRNRFYQKKEIVNAAPNNSCVLYLQSDYFRFWIHPSFFSHSFSSSLTLFCALLLFRFGGL
jgi:hypothetical protein